MRIDGKLLHARTNRGELYLLADERRLRGGHRRADCDHRVKLASHKRRVRPGRPSDNAGSREAPSRGRCMCVSVAAASYGLPLENVQEVIGVRPVTRVFHGPAVFGRHHQPAR